MESILTSIKKMLGIEEGYEHFDTDIMIHINSTLMVLRQLGVGPADGFRITGSSETWDDYLGDNTHMDGVKTYVYWKVRLMFDPPTSSAHMEAMKNGIAEFEWRLNAEAESN